MLSFYKLDLYILDLMCKKEYHRKKYQDKVADIFWTNKSVTQKQKGV